jgi:hypothetical protein
VTVHYIQVWFTLGKLKAELGEPEEARMYLNQYLLHWGNADWELDDVKGAKRLLQQLDEQGQ